ncbi:MAG: DoxX family protein [Polyangiales bacterium]
MAITASENHASLAANQRPVSKGLNITLWVIQGLMGAMFIFAGVMKFVMSVEEMTKDMAMPGWFLHFIGVAELAGGLGLLLPGILKIRRGLTPLAAAGLTIIMVGAVVVTGISAPSNAVMPLVCGLLTAFIAYKRWPWLTHG